MATSRQIEANRRNAQKSTGPTTPEGKAAASMNPLKTGLYAKSDILPWEDPEEYNELIEQFYHDYQPANATERHYLDDMIYCEWNLQRLHMAERQLTCLAYTKCPDPNPELKLGEICYRHSKLFAQLQWRMDSNRRAYNRSLQMLLELQAARRKAEAEAAPRPEPVPATETQGTPLPEIGFVPNPGPEPVFPAAKPSRPALVPAPEFPDADPAPPPPAVELSNSEESGSAGRPKR